MTATAQHYADGYAEGRRTALHLVCPLEDSVVLAMANEEIRGEWRTRRAYWYGMKRALRLHYHEAYRPNVLAARARRDRIARHTLRERG
jgi:hypothetical protein